MAVPGEIEGGVDINNLVLFGQYLQLTVHEFSNMTLRQIVRSPSFSTVVNASPTLLDKYRLGFGLNATTEQGVVVMDGLPSDDACGKGQTMCAVFTAISFFLVLMRMSSRWMSGSKLRWDDHLCWMAFVFVVLIQCAEVTACHLESVHGGRHFWDVTISQYRNILIWAFAIESTYYPNLCLIKLSILLFYYYLFRAQPRLQITCKLLAWMLAVGNVFPVLGFFQFTPIDVWNHILDAKPAFHRYAYFSSIGYISILSDFILLVLPISVLPKVRLRLREKIILAGIFFVGTFKDWSYASANTAIWSMLELHLAIFCACVPNLKMLASRVATWLRKLGGKSHPSHSSPNSAIHSRLTSSFSIIHSGKNAKSRNGSGGTDIERTAADTSRSRRQESEGGLASSGFEDCDGGSKWSKGGAGATVSVSSQPGMSEYFNPCEGGPTMPTAAATAFPHDFTPPTEALSPIQSALEPIDFEAEHVRHKMGLVREHGIAIATGVLDSFDDVPDLEHELREMVREVELMRRDPRNKLKAEELAGSPLGSCGEWAN